MEYLSTVLVLMVILIAFAFAVRNIIKKGDTCGCGCKSCGKCSKCSKSVSN